MTDAGDRRAEGPPGVPGADGVVEDLAVERVVPGGDGLARSGGVVTLVPGALPGDTVRAVTGPAGRGLRRGRLVSVVAAGPHRRPAEEVCPHARDGSCGGCDWPAARLESHAELKAGIVRDALRRIGRLSDADVPELRFTGSPRGYRLRSRLHVDALGRVGFFGGGTTDVADMQACELISPELLARLPAVRDAFRDAGPAAGDLTTLESRDGSAVLGHLFASAGRVPGAARLVERLAEALDGIAVKDGSGALLRHGPGFLSLPAGGASFRVSATSFFQGNRYLLDAFQDEVRGALLEAGTPKPLARGLDLYAGVGFLTWPLLSLGMEATAVEADRSSASDLAANLEAWGRGGGVPRATAVTGTAEELVASLRTPPDVVVSDPPRAGMSPAVRRALIRLAPRALVLVSCDPATFARDVAALHEGYRLARLSLLDLFPQTHHVETVALLLPR